MFLDDDNVASYADDTTPYAMNSLQALKEVKDNWFTANYCGANPKFLFLLALNEQLSLNLHEQLSLNLHHVNTKNGKSRNCLV